MDSRSRCCRFGGHWEFRSLVWCTSDSRLWWPEELRAPSVTRGAGGTVASHWHPQSWGTLRSVLITTAGGFSSHGCYKVRDTENPCLKSKPNKTNPQTKQPHWTRHKGFGILAVNSAKLISELLPTEQRGCVPGEWEAVLLDSSTLTQICLSLGWTETLWQQCVGFLLTDVTVWRRRGRLVF